MILDEYKSALAFCGRMSEVLLTMTPMLIICSICSVLVSTGTLTWETAANCLFLSFGIYAVTTCVVVILTLTVLVPICIITRVLFDIFRSRN